MSKLAANQEATEGSEPVPYKPLKELLLQRSSARGAAPAQLAAPQAVPGQERAQAPQQVHTLSAAAVTAQNARTA